MDLVVRQVAMVSGSAHFVFVPTGEVSSCFRGQDRKLTRAEMKRLKKGEMIEMGSELRFRSWKVPPGPAGFVTITAFTGQEF
jgi:hypothetical protein